MEQNFRELSFQATRAFSVRFFTAYKFFKIKSKKSIWFKERKTWTELS